MNISMMLNVLVKCIIDVRDVIETSLDVTVFAGLTLYSGITFHPDSESFVITFRSNRDFFKISSKFFRYFSNMGNTPLMVRKWAR